MHHRSSLCICCFVVLWLASLLFTGKLLAQTPGRAEYVITNEAGERFMPGEAVTARKGITLTWAARDEMELSVFDDQGELIARRVRTADDQPQSVFVPLDRWAGHRLLMSLALAGEPRQISVQVKGWTQPGLGYQP